MVSRVAVGSMVGVAIPLASEWALRGRRLGLDPEVRPKISGLLGVGLGAVGLGLAVSSHVAGVPRMTPQNANMLASFGGACMATGIGILAIDAVRPPVAPAVRPAPRPAPAAPAPRRALEVEEELIPPEEIGLQEYIPPVPEEEIVRI